MKSHEYSKYSSLRVATIQSGIPDPRSGNGGGDGRKEGRQKVLYEGAALSARSESSRARNALLLAAIAGAPARGNGRAL